MKINERVMSHLDASDYSIQLNRWFLKSVGAWPSSASTTVKEKVISIVLIIICYSLIAYTVVPCILNILLEETDMHKKLQAIGPLNHWNMGGMNYFSLLFRSRDIYRCVEHVRTDWRMITDTEDRQVMLKYANFGGFFAGLCAIFMHGGVFSHSVMQGIMPTFVYIGNVSVSIHVLPCPTYSKFIDITKSPAGEIAFTVQLISSIVVNSVTAGACSLAAVFAMHACGQLNILMRWLDQLDDRKQQDMIQNRWAIIVEHHLRVLSFVAQMEALLNQICFVELLGCTFNLCMLGYYIITGWNTIETKMTIACMMIIYVSMTFNIFIFCYIGETVTEQCKQVGEIAYMTNWYCLPHKTARSLVLIISRSSNVIKLTAGKLFHLSIATFGDVMRTSMIYPNMLRTMTGS
ncbi:PREDICTED: odorant receptor 82a-like [Acromyrmex echinatior]|uniref:odorant receptor 82a-like n=1 Tax=Acromyrmex echinatior TaxID=103372 RepID=UPI000580C997|nr:PREDICTED: odorant receptor 82a-like [Acromyrmex echinatior]